MGMSAQTKARKALAAIEVVETAERPSGEEFEKRGNLLQRCDNALAHGYNVTLGKMILDGCTRSAITLSGHEILNDIDADYVMMLLPDAYPSPLYTVETGYSTAVHGLLSIVTTTVKKNKIRRV